MDVARTITDFADQAVMLPMAAAIGILLFAMGWRRGAIAWFAVISGMLALMLVLKVWAGACGAVVYGDDLQSPSGHTASAAAIYGGALTLLLRRTIRRVPIGFICAGVFAVLVGVTRVTLGAHSVIEVAIGAFVGVTAAMVLEWAAGPVPHHLPVFRPAAVVIAVLLVFHGLHMPAEAAIRRIRIDWLATTMCPASAGHLPQTGFTLRS